MERTMYGEILYGGRSLQTKEPVLRHEGEEPDCKHCVSKAKCGSNRLFFDGEKYKPCRDYYELNDQFAEYKRIEGLKEVFDPTPRPEGAARDCLHCRWLPERLGAVCGQFYPQQGANKTCSNYYDIPVRPEGEPQHCKNCYHNFRCRRDRVVRVGTPCERYFEYTAGTVKAS